MLQAKNWQKALELYEDLKSAKIEQTVSTVNALITALCKCPNVTALTNGVMTMQFCF